MENRALIVAIAQLEREYEKLIRTRTALQAERATLVSRIAHLEKSLSEDREIVANDPRQTIENHMYLSKVEREVERKREELVRAIDQLEQKRLIPINDRIRFTETKRRSLERLIERRAEVARSVASKREQHLTDEAGLRRFVAAGLKDR